MVAIVVAFILGDRIGDRGVLVLIVRRLEVVGIEGETVVVNQRDLGGIRENTYVRVVNGKVILR